MGKPPGPTRGPRLRSRLLSFGIRRLAAQEVCAAQSASKHLSRHVVGKFVDDADVARLLEPSQVSMQEVEDLVGPKRLAFPRHHPGLYRLARLVVGDAHHGRLCHVRMTLDGL